ncbi:MAG: hypothetical protein P8I94_05410, partial [Emcibacteraceae bacterium]|nr:hypothetical protein [Emcibacteraceae bacterium]
MSQTTQEAIDALTASTTAILTELITQKASYQTITQAIVDAAQDLADLAETSKGEAESAAAQALADRLLAQSAKNAAEIAQASAESIVTGGTASTTPTASLIPLADTSGKIDKDWLGAEALAMSKQEFDALAEKRKADSAGSGFAEWGSHYDASGNPNYADYAINQGLWTHNAAVNEKSTVLHMGRRSSDASGSSKTMHPTVSVNGSILNLDAIAKGGLSDGGIPNDYSAGVVSFPPAPDGSIVVHGDGSQTEYASAAEAIAGYAGLDYTETYACTGAVAYEDYIEFATDGGTSYWASRYFDIDEAAEYYISFEIFDYVSGKMRLNCYADGEADGTLLFDIMANGRYEKKITPNDLAQSFGSDDDRFAFYVPAADTAHMKIRNIQIRKADDKPLASRQDFVFLEAWHEKISDKDWFCPLGNSQFGASTFEGISGLSNTTIAQGYSAFGEWDTDTKGYGHTWSTMSEAEKLIAIQNPENNIYRDGDDLIQVRYRVRVIKGLGDDWARVTPDATGSNQISLE